MQQHSSRPGAKPTSVTELSTVARVTFTVGLPMLRNLTLPVAAFQSPAGARGIVLLVTVGSCVALRALTGVSSASRRALTVQTPGETEAFRASLC